MNPRLLFWIPALLRMGFVLTFAGIAWYLLGMVSGLTLAVLLLGGMVLVQLHYLNQLSNWLDHPSSAKLPDGWGAWTDVFARLYRLRRDDERNKDELCREQGIDRDYLRVLLHRAKERFRRKYCKCDDDDAAGRAAGTGS